MKKFFALLILTLFCGANSCYAFSELYYFKNIKTEDVAPVVNTELQAQNFNIVKQNPYYAISPKKDDYAVIILQQSGDNMFYYYRSDKNTKINKSILKEIKRRNIVCEQSFNSNIISIYDGLSEDLLASSGAEKVYSFDEEEIVFAPPVQQKQVNKPQTFSGYVAQLNSGTLLNAYLQNSINTANAAKGDRVIAILTDSVSVNGDVVIPQGSAIYGTLKKARNATYGSRNGRVVISFNQIVTPENQIYNITAEDIDFTVSNEGKVMSAAGNVVKTAAAGAVVGLLLALLTDSHNVGRGAAIGAGVGAGSALVYSTAEKGIDAEIPSYTELEITLTSPLNISITK